MKSKTYAEQFYRKSCQFRVDLSANLVIFSVFYYQNGTKEFYNCYYPLAIFVATQNIIYNHIGMDPRILNKPLVRF